MLVGERSQRQLGISLGSPSGSPIPAAPRLDRLTVFAFIWTCQALVHQEFYKGWVGADDWAGWLVTILGVTVLLRPTSLRFFAALLVASVVYNVRKWPFVVNHILVESVIDMVILAAMIAAARARWDRTGELGDRIFDRFAPVVRVMLIVMYSFAVLAKLNADFLDPDYSCVTMMYGTLLRRLPFLPTERWGIGLAIWGTVAIEFAIPLLLAFRRTRWLAIAIGLPFHLMLGLVGHRTFSALAYALYSLFLIDTLTPVVQRGLQRIQGRWSATRRQQVLRLYRVGLPAGVLALVLLERTGRYEAGVGPFDVYRFAWVVWILWSLALMALYALAIQARRFGPRPPKVVPRPVRPGLLWIGAGIVLLNGLSQYLGLKTETCFTMYSNLRTEGGVANHLFMPALRLAPYQDDLVDIVSTTHPLLQQAVEKQQYVTSFEFRRILSTAQEDFEVVYRRNGGPEARFERRAGVPSDPQLAKPHPLLLAKLLYFRPVPKAVRCPCLH